MLSKTPINEKDAVSDETIIRTAIIGELDAINLYQQLSRSAKNSKLKKLLLDIAKEEKVHVGELEAMLEQIDPERKTTSDEGKAEMKKFKEWLESRVQNDQPTCTMCGNKISKNEPHGLCSKCRIALYTASMKKK